MPLIDFLYGLLAYIAPPTKLGTLSVPDVEILFQNANIITPTANAMSTFLFSYHLFGISLYACLYASSKDKSLSFIMHELYKIKG